ncbi:hypothetical protein LOTGIDRAFT_221814 [Lottia gigantea]|uniref:RIIa domain-containing protein n=1 Tax=Lottia gigantea TaxID=225164 RepID=V3ZVE2_LOTGI|nr:hypothetical protein LOTGIDRAFT_221814 [Lottia gigantea]ESO84886.1 hypothetical protein LOTGIDRAFT_221814 [Lottia gigantea]
MADTPQHTTAHGMEPYDLSGPTELGALSKEQQEKLNSFKIKTRVGNEAYMREHPEIECMLDGFLSDVLTKRPENIREYAAQYFTVADLNVIVEKQMENRQSCMKQNKILQKIGRL